MGSQSQATIEIGGSLAKAGLAQLVEAIYDQGVITDDGPDLNSIDDVEKYVLHAIEHGKRLNMYDSSASWGNLDDLTQACRELKLTYRHSWSGNYDYGAGTRYWDASMQADADGVEADLNYEDDVVVDIMTVVRRMKEGTWDEFRRRMMLLVDPIPPLKWDE